jgi:hypothetical protein
MAFDNLYWPGVSEACERVSRMDDERLYQHIDSLYGRAKLPDDPTHDQLVAEALEQTRRDFRNPDARHEWEFVEATAAALRHAPNAEQK